MKLRDIAHARSGDKGDTSTISLVAYAAEDYPRLAAYVTPDRVKQHFASIVKGNVKRFELPQLGALNFVLERALGGGVTRSLAIDAHGKSLSSLLLEMEVPDR